MSEFTEKTAQEIFDAISRHPYTKELLPNGEIISGVSVFLHGNPNLSSVKVREVVARMAQHFSGIYYV